MSTEEATINPDGSTTYEGDGSDDGNTMPPVTDESTAGGGGPADEGFGGTDYDYDETMGDDDAAGEKVVNGGLLNDPAIFLLVAAILLGLGYFLYRRRQAAEEEDEFFASLDGEKVRRGKKRKTDILLFMLDVSYERGGKGSFSVLEKKRFFCHEKQKNPHYRIEFSWYFFFCVVVVFLSSSNFL